MSNMTVDELDKISDEKHALFGTFLEKQCGIVLGANKQYLVRSRLSTLRKKLRFKSMDEMLNRVVTAHDRVLNSLVVDAMTTNETMWFRDVYPYTILKEQLLPNLAQGNHNIRIWSAACSSGQEPYSIAMTLFESIPRMLIPGGARVSITATDISDSMLDICRAGIYDSFALSRGLSPERRQTFFEKCPNMDGEHRIIEKVRRLVTFKRLNLLDNFSILGRFDIIFCRNVLIYFSPDIKRRIIAGMVKCLNPGGYLFLGSSEYINNLNLDDYLEMVRFNPGMAFRRKPGVLPLNFGQEFGLNTPLVVPSTTTATTSIASSTASKLSLNK